MLFLSCFALVGLVVSLAGFLMFAFPARYVGIVNWYFSKIGFGRPVFFEKYSRWPYRLSGFVLFLMSLLIFYEFSLQLKNYLR